MARQPGKKKINKTPPSAPAVPANDEKALPPAAGGGNSFADRKGAAKAALEQAAQQAGPLAQRAIEAAKNHPVLVGGLSGFLFGGPTGALLGAASSTEAGKKALKQMVEDGVDTVKRTIKAVKEARQETAEDRERRELQARLDELNKKRKDGPGPT